MTLRRNLSNNDENKFSSGPNTDLRMFFTRKNNQTNNLKKPQLQIEEFQDEEGRNAAELALMAMPMPTEKHSSEKSNLIHMPQEIQASLYEFMEHQLEEQNDWNKRNLLKDLKSEFNKQTELMMT